MVDDWISFKGVEQVGSLIQELRYELNKLLEHKITHPGITSWDKKGKEGALMHAIVDLLMGEEEEVVELMPTKKEGNRKRGWETRDW